MASMVLTTVFPAYTTVAPATSATAKAVAQPCKHNIIVTINNRFIVLSTAHPGNFYGLFITKHRHSI